MPAAAAAAYRELDCSCSVLGGKFDGLVSKQYFHYEDAYFILWEALEIVFCVYLNLLWLC